MKRLIWLFAVIAIAIVWAAPQQEKSASLDGRWDLTLTEGANRWPSWIEVSGSKVGIVGQTGSLHPATDVKVDGSRLSFSSGEWAGKNTKVQWEITQEGGKLTGTQKRDDGTEAQLTGERAPALKREVKNWGKPEPIFNGKDLTGWSAITTGEPGKSPEIRYVARDGELVNEAPGANIRTDRTFDDFKLHVEYNCPKDGNSGVYLRGRYEVQVEYESAAANDRFHGMGSIYGFLAPAKQVAARPGEWETYDVTLVGRRVTVVRNGVTTIDKQEIPGITGGAVDSHEGEPGPIYIQGDHTGGMKYRNITIAQPAH